MVRLSNGLQGYTISVVRKNAKYIDLKRIEKAYKCDPESNTQEQDKLQAHYMS
jgi:hypothetical protein